jgi:hypothetical protein
VARMYADIYPDFCFLRGKAFRKTGDVLREERVVVKRIFLQDPLSAREMEIFQESMEDPYLEIVLSDQCA